ncbi:hypothetical protein [Simkania sp.]|uniref:hypothetical protein n=1 Tax=Simkania sp. TaxID=34094 RepID=UPI003B520FD9
MTSFVNRIATSIHDRWHGSSAVPSPVELPTYNPQAGEAVKASTSSSPGELPGYNPHSQEAIEGAEKMFQVSKAANDPGRTWNVLFVGGILNREADVLLNVDKLQNKTGVPVQHFWNRVYATQRSDREPKADVVNDLAGKIEAYLSIGQLCIIAHSHGTKVTSMALDSLQKKGAVKTNDNRLEVYGIGGVEGIPEDSASYVENYKNKDDHTQSLGKVLWHANKSVEWDKTDRAGNGHAFIGGYDDYATEKVVEFVLRHSAVSDEGA